ncbi:MAG: acylneuraminate cytidylyltransferase family protein [Dehalococcoidales bacterium]|nr:acylneuraminate cytidylyltransferase family protein [Dehalococcoidales bacterium]
MNIVAIIHARGGSKRIPFKNIKALAGKPLIAYMIQAALKAETINRVIVSTDHQEIIRITKEYGAEVPFVRPKDLAEDVPSELVTQHAVNYLEKEENYRVDIVVTLQPTTPLCLPEDIDGCVHELISSGADSVFSAYEISERPEWMFRLDESGYAHNYLNRKIEGDIGISQTLPRLYIPNGGIYATRREVLSSQNNLLGEKTRLWIMPRERSVDIDEPIDFLYAEFLIQQKLAKINEPK